MGYVESVLAPGERVVHRAALSHWNFVLSYFLGALCIVGAGAAVYLDRQRGPLIAAVATIVGLLFIGVALVRRGTSELVLTDRRIIAKRGFIARTTVEMQLAKVESLHVHQGLLARMLDYGDVTVVGTGSSLEPLRGICAPLELRRKLGEIAVTPRPPAPPA
ncbi:MAG TPA: PH domain-containing protein [Burkholderiales bacterium]|nr:PH domain-containing protein [Burkholderiales bacterium]